MKDTLELWLVDTSERQRAGESARQQLVQSHGGEYWDNGKYIIMGL